MQQPSIMAYSLSQRFLHWTVALLIFFNLLFPDGMNVWHRLMRRGQVPTPEQVSSANIHAYVGIAILLLAIVRLGLRVTKGVPAEAAKEPAIFRLAARLAHAGLYILIFAMPLTGIAAYYFGINPAGSLHADILKIILWALIAAHVAGALVHHFYWKTNVLRRMTFG
ncbi:MULTISPECIES: cytochrome b/b6 domain-containing protein [unclassified Rhizobium]|uniref:cytochrome b n=1 Tax=unclassified Rhizobium TaxID=2613769 RepID=UPI001A99E08E|nr:MULTISPECIES: cytochrome b/b6 domain-containing protein [unclassified Rhizobium]MBX5158394.1 cytochrome b [Rhizobium sp. NZLR8]MBX5163706.1 cytochrome b [Rhizobium sp. NZLR4b]MBX5169467.1 cytochrome b [Rhizobium sp. NZLR1b]MBX5183043.1 cytochrome b [Rhizobium sp. NZLR5]MBX5189391.1 cytochrome b [Rhizobium sp. NZLR3b]